MRRFDPGSEDAFTVSRTRIQNFLDCKRCFYLQNRIGIKALRSLPFRLNSATDTLLKKTFDAARKKQEPHRYFKRDNINLVPFSHEKMDEWRENFQGVKYHYKKANLMVQGAVDDTPDSAVRVYDAEHPPTYTLPPVLTSVDYSPDGKLLAVSGFHEVLIYDTASNQPVARLIGLSPRIQSLSFSPDGKRLAVTGGKPAQFGEIQIWDVAKRLLKFSSTLTFDTIFGVSWSPDGKLVSFGCTDNSVRAIEIESGKQVLYQGAHGDWVLDTTFSVDASHLVSVSRDRSMKLTQVDTERFVDNITSITPGALKGGLMTVRRNPLSDELLVGGADGIPKIYQMYRTKARRIGDDFNLVRAFEAMPGRIFAVDFSTNGELITAGSSFNGKGEVRCYNTVDGKRLATFEGQRGPVYTLRFHPSGGQVASGGFDGVVRINDSKTGKLLSEFVSVPVRAEEVAKKSQ